MKSEYTKGEWKVRKLVENELWIMCNNIVIAQTYIADGNEEANAHLIAQAPKLYEVCKRLLDEAQALPAINMWQVHYSIVKQIAEAIAEVEVE